MSLRQQWTRWVVLVAVVILTMTMVSAQEDTSVRFVHAVPGAGAVDVYINGTLALSGLSFGEVSTYLSVPAGDHTATVTPNGMNNPLWEQTISATADSATTFIASDGNNLQFDAYLENLGSTNFGFTRLLLIHAIADAPAVDVVLAEPIVLNNALQDAGTALANGMAYRTGFGDFDLPAQTYTVNVLPTGSTDVAVERLPLRLSSGTSHIAIVYGTIDQPRALLTSAATSGSADDGFVRFAHGIVGAPAVDVYVNDTLLVPGLDTAQPSAHIALPAGDHSLLLRAAGTEDEIVSGGLSIEAGTAQTIIALADADGVQVASFADDLSGLTPETAVVSVINAVPESSLGVSLDDGTVLTDSTVFGDMSGAVGLDAVVASASYTLTVGDSSGTLTGDSGVFYGGVYYNIIALAGDMFNAPRLIVAPTSLQQGLSSAPAGAEIAVSQPVAPVETTETEVEQVVTVTEATPEPVVVATIPEDAITARVLLNPGANLQLRQYPSAEAASLGLAPSGSTLVVLGREGAPVALVEGQAPPPEAEDFVDPATLLEDERDDLVAEETWLRVRFDTADGGQITAWVNALYVEVRDADGRRQRLADLDMIGGNIPGQAVNTAVTPPPPPEDRLTAVVININPDAALNLRRTPGTDGEVLARLNVNTIVEFVGVIAPDEDGEQVWYFVRHLPTEGGVVTGWASVNFLRLEYNGRTTDLEELAMRELLEEIDATRRGEIGSGAPGVAIPTPDPLVDAYVAIVVLDPGANLQFRRNPDATSESLNLIPSGTQLIITARTLDGDWLRTSFENQVGWIASGFVSLTFNGNPAEITDIPVDTSLTPTTDADNEG